MVMHARKLPRISDGFSEKHQPHSHGYENAKYNNKFRYGNHDKNRDSPSTNSLRSSSPDSQSPRYHKSNYYKVRERERERENRERERERDRSYNNYRDREMSRSPKDRRRDRDREREKDLREPRTGLHDRVMPIHKKDLIRIGDWSEHVSSSGKKYYYNCRSEVSQWEKPPEWVEFQRDPRPSIALKDSNIHRVHEKSSRPDKHSSLTDNYRDRREYRGEDHFERRELRKYPQDVGTTDMDISSGDSTPTSEGMHLNRMETPGQDASESPSVSSLPLMGVSSGLRSLKTSTITVTPTATTSDVSVMMGSVTPAVPQLLNSHPRLSALTSRSDAKGEDKANKLPLEPISINPSSSNIMDPNANPTPAVIPTDSENITETNGLRKLGSRTSVYNYTSVVSPIHLTPSLVNYYKETLIGHAQGWPSEPIEKQCHRSIEEAHGLTSIIMTKVSSDLKMARSLVRLAEIQATLHEQRILFLRAQKRALEEVKAHNSFLNDT